MYALRKYVQATGDESFLWDCGAEMLVETARLWLDLGFLRGRKRRELLHQLRPRTRRIHTVVNNNAYTN